MDLKKEISFSKTEVLLGVLSMILICLSVFTTRQLRLTSTNAIIFSDELVLQIHEQTDLNGLITTLDSLNVSYSDSDLRWAAKLLGWRSFQKGSYSFNGNRSYDGFLSKLSRGIQDPVSLTVLPGITKERFARSVSLQINISEEDVLSLFSDSLFLATQSLSSEEMFGRMLPETYLMYWTSSSKEVVRRILREFEDKVVKPHTDELNLQERTASEIVIMASIVEWEANNEGEKPIISGLYWNRFNKRMRLQADPTINFALGERRRLLFEDYELEHPYNTYLKRGLPPGPITNPSLSTIKATINPHDHDYIYMVANPEGGHVFTETFAQHQIESEKWRKWLRQQYRIKRERERGSLNN